MTFYYVEMIVGAPLFIGVFSLVAASAIPDPGGRPVGIGAAVLAVLVAHLTSRTPYMAAVGADGSMTFKALTRSTTTSLSAVVRIGVRSSGRGGATWIFFFNGGSGQLGGIAGRQLARYVVSRNPLVQFPANRLKM